MLTNHKLLFIVFLDHFFELGAFSFLSPRATNRKALPAAFLIFLNAGDFEVVFAVTNDDSDAIEDSGDIIGLW